MNKLSRLALALVAVAASAAAVAEPFDTADRARRERNREEILARQGDVSNTTYRGSTYRADEDRSTMREKGHRVADKTRSLGHRTADKMRNFGERQNRRFGGRTTTKPDPYAHGPQ